MIQVKRQNRTLVKVKILKQNFIFIQKHREKQNKMYVYTFIRVVNVVNDHR